MFKTSPVKAEALVKQVEEQLNAALADVAKMEGEYNSASLKLVTGAEGANAGHMKLERELTKRRKRAASLQAALTAANGEHAAAIEAEAARALEMAWADTERIGQERLALAAKIERAAVELAKDIGALALLGEKMFFCAPKKDLAFHDSLLSPGHIQRSFMLFLRKQGCTWAAGWDGDVRHILTFVERAAGGNSWALKFRKQQNQ